LIGDIRLSDEFYNKLGAPTKRKYKTHTITDAKNIGRLEIFSDAHQSN